MLVQNANIPPSPLGRLGATEGQAKWKMTMENDKIFACHSRESGNPENVGKLTLQSFLDSRFRGNDEEENHF